MRLILCRSHTTRQKPTQALCTLCIACSSMSYAMEHGKHLPAQSRRVRTARCRTSMRHMRSATQQQHTKPTNTMQTTSNSTLKPDTTASTRSTDHEHQHPTTTASIDGNAT